MTQQTGNKGLRWWVLIIAAINPFFSYLSDALGLSSKNIAEVSMQYNSYFMPAGYAFSIWGIIYLSFIIYAVYQLLPAQQHNSFYDRLTIPFITANVLGIIWQVVFTHEMITVGTCIIIAMLVFAGIMFVRVKQALKSEAYSRWLSVPFSLYLGWLSVANIANASLWFIYMGWHGAPLTEQTWTIIMIVTALLLGIFISLRFRDIIYPLVVAWTCVALYINNQYANDTIAKDAILAGTVLLIYTLSYSIWQYLHDVHETHGKWMRRHDNRILKH